MSTLPAAEAQSVSEAPLPHTGASATYAICLPSMPSDALLAMIARLQGSLPGQPLLIASPDQAEETTSHGGTVRLVPYPVQRTGSEWVLSAADYLAAYRLAEDRGLTGVMLIGSEAATLDLRSLPGFQDMLASGIDLAVPRYHLRPDEGLVNSALLYPLTRALFGVDIRFPLPLDAALSIRMLSRLGGIAARQAGPTDEALVWPVAEASIAGFAVRQMDGVERALPRPQEADLNVLFPTVCASLFTDIEAKAAYWQRARTLPTGRPQINLAKGTHAVEGEEIRSLVDGFRLAFSNLREIWSLVLPPQSLLSLKKLSLMPVETFAFPPNLWARVVYDFALAFHMRTLNRGHLLGAMTPLYLAWVAGLLRESGGVGADGVLLETTATAFEQEKPYLVSRWRWPDRFNP